MLSQLALQLAEQPTDLVHVSVRLFAAVVHVVD